MIDSIEARHAREQAEQRRVGREAIADAGPHLADEDATIVIPSPNYHPELGTVLKSYGFRFEHGACPWWERATGKSMNGITHTPAAWLNWAIRRYAWAWPKWEKDEGRLE